jgi:hypothetical protein
MPHSVTMCRASLVACWKSLLAPEVTWSTQSIFYPSSHIIYAFIFVRLMPRSAIISRA